MNFKRVSFFKLILFYIALIFFLPLLVTIVTSFSLHKNFVIEKVKNDHGLITSHINYEISELLKNFEKFTQLLKSNNDVYDKFLIDTYSKMNSEIIDSFTVIQIVNMDNKTKDSKNTNTKFNWKAENNSTISTSVNVDKYNISISYNINNLFRNFQNSFNCKENDCEFIIFDDNKIIYSSIEDFIKIDYLLKTFKDKDKNTTVNYNDQKFFINNFPFVLNEASFLTIYNATNESYSFNRMKIILTLIGIVGWLIIVFVLYRFHHNILLPLKEISSKTTVIASGNYRYIKGNYLVKEVNFLENNIHEMIDAIRLREEIIKDSEIKYRSLIEESVDLIFRFDSKFNLLYVSRSIEQILGYTQNEFKNLYSSTNGRKTSIFPNKSMNLIGIKSLRHLFKKRRPVCPFYIEVRHKDGFSVYLEVQMNLSSNDEEFESIQGIARDITTRYQVEQKMERLKDYLSNIIESMPSIIITFDQWGNIAMCNSFAVTFLNIDGVALEGKKLWDLSKRFLRYKELFEQIRSSNEAIDIKEEITISPGNKTFFKGTLFPINDVSNGIVLRIEDVSKMEIAEMKLRQAERLRTIGAMAGGLAHDFNNILGAILGTMSLIEYKIKNKQRIQYANIVEDFEIIVQACEKGENLIKELMTISKKKFNDFENIDLETEINQAVILCRNSFSKSVRLEKVIKAENTMIKGVPGQIQQMLLNLLINAKDAMEEKGKIHIELIDHHIEDDKFVTENQFENIDYCVIKIKDNGRGIPEELVDNIFDPFFSTKEASKGAGLGLTMVYNIVKNHNGFVNCKSEISKGTVFTIYLPTVEQKEGFAEVSRNNEIMYKGTGIVFIIDDEKSIRNMTGKILKECGYKVLEAATGFEAMDMFIKYHDDIDCVLMDLYMPDFSGVELYKKILEVDKEKPVIITSGPNTDNDLSEIMEIGNPSYLKKPYSMLNLSKKIHDVINGID